MSLKKISVMLLTLLLLPLSAEAGKKPSLEGAYTTLPGAEFKFDGKTVEVVEFLSFSCGTCYAFERSVPIIKGNFPKKIKWTIVPIYWGGKKGSLPAEAYLLAVEAGKGEKMKKALFQASMVDKLNITDVNVLERIAGRVGLGFDFSRKIRTGAKAGEVQKGLDLAKTYSINETPTLVIAGNVATNPHTAHHDLDQFRMNVITIIKSILK
ncbi:MAG: DsbA family protein [Proteobacteria bacterium]|nr:DsbA family protein [Pseudomonadota bacterium]